MTAASKNDPWVGNMALIMLAGEEDAGRKPVWPHHKRRPKWFHAEDWAQWPVISYDDHEVHVVAVSSARRGAFSRLVREVRAAGLTPVVVEPMGPTMPAILERWGWQMSVNGEGWDHREEWRPAPTKQARPCVQRLQ
ncbi:MAG TPA: hypothetical protein VF637_09120, partial [Sphingomicrobium sp.]